MILSFKAKKILEQGFFTICSNINSNVLRFNYVPAVAKIILGTSIICPHDLFMSTPFEFRPRVWFCELKLNVQKEYYVIKKLRSFKRHIIGSGSHPAASLVVVQVHERPRLRLLTLLHSLLLPLLPVDERLGEPGDKDAANFISVKSYISQVSMCESVAY